MYWGYVDKAESALSQVIEYCRYCELRERGSGIKELKDILSKETRNKLGKKTMSKVKEAILNPISEYKINVIK